MSLKRVLLIFGLAFLFQASLANLFAINGVTPNLILCMAISIVFYYNEGYKAIPVALISMLLLDICTAQYVGVGTLALFLTILFVILCRINLNVEKWPPTATTVVLSVYLFYFVEWIAYKLMGNAMGFGHMLLSTLGYMIYDLVVVSITYLFIAHIIIKKKPEASPEEEAKVDFEIEL